MGKPTFGDHEKRYRRWSDDSEENKPL